MCSSRQSALEKLGYRPKCIYNELGEILIDWGDRKVMMGSRFGDNYFYCSKCFKLYFTPWMLEKHVLKCHPIFHESTLHSNALELCVIRFDSPRNEKVIPERISRLAKTELGWDFALLRKDNWERLFKKTAFVLRLREKVLGYILVADSEKRCGAWRYDLQTRARDKVKSIVRYIMGEIYVIAPERRKGYGRYLFDTVLRQLKETPETVAYSLPITGDFRRFLEKKGVAKIFGVANF